MQKILPVEVPCDGISNYTLKHFTCDREKTCKGIFGGENFLRSVASGATLQEVGQQKLRGKRE